MSARLSLIVAAAENDVIGADDKLPWHLPADLRRFRELTTGHVLLMGRRTHDSIVARNGRPLPGRFSVVVTREPRPSPYPSVLFLPSWPEALAAATGIAEFAGRDEVFVIGGAQIYALALSQVDRVHLTRVHQAVEGDTTMPQGWLDGFETVSEEPGDGFTFQVLRRAR